MREVSELITQRYRFMIALPLIFQAEVAIKTGTKVVPSYMEVTGSFGDKVEMNLVELTSKSGTYKYIYSQLKSGHNETLIKNRVFLNSLIPFSEFGKSKSAIIGCRGDWWNQLQLTS